MQPPVLAAEPIKEQVVDAVPKRIKELKFGILSVVRFRLTYYVAETIASSKQDIVNQGVLEVCDRALFDLERNRAARTNGPLDPRLGVSNKNAFCDTCGQTLQVCNGHFGHVRLALPAFHVGYFKMIVTILQEICKVCGNLMG